MRNIIIGLVLAVTLNSTCFAKEPLNLQTYKTRLIKYHDSGEYTQDQAKVMNEAMQYLKTRLAKAKRNPPKKPFAVILDIDETSLSNYEDMLLMDFGGVWNEVDIAEGAGHDPAIAPALEFYRYAKANKVAIFFVTSRRESYRAGTEKNLRSVGFNEWKGLTLKPDNYKLISAVPFKTGARQAIENLGYEIVLNIGDQQSDLNGGHAGKSFKIPNPYYFTP